MDSVDNLDRALTTVPAEKLSGEDSNKDLVNLYDGLKMTERILMQTLKKHGLERFDPSENGEKFDPNLHEATFQTPVAGKEDGTAFHTQQKGFMLNGRVLRVSLCMLNSCLDSVLTLDHRRPRLAWSRTPEDRSRSPFFGFAYAPRRSTCLWV